MLGLCGNYVPMGIDGGKSLNVVFFSNLASFVVFTLFYIMIEFQIILNTNVLYIMQGIDGISHI